MIAKQKAEELFVKMLETDILMDDINAKQCALIAVDEIINTGLLLDSSIYVMVKTSLDYWQQVKQEIEKL
jgi:hypothetical protein